MKKAIIQSLIIVLFIIIIIIINYEIAKSDTSVIGVSGLSRQSDGNISKSISSDKLNITGKSIFSTITATTYKGISASSTTGIMQKIFETTIAGSAVSAINITGLDGNTDIQYELIYHIRAVNTGSVYITFNNDAGANKYSQYGANYRALPDVSTGAASSLGTNMAFAGVDAAGNVVDGKSELYAVTGKPRIVRTNSGNYPELSSGQYRVTWSSNQWYDSTTNITSIQIGHTVANSIGVDSHVELWARR